jgi:hypothetical protein
MRIVKIPKKHGKTRTIYAVNRQERREYRWLLRKHVAPLATKMCNASVVHGFTHNRNAVTNAMAHVRRAYTITADLRDFFDSIRLNLARLPIALLPIADKLFVDGAPRQGLPTSPAVANIAAAGMDESILNWARGRGLRIVYTRYADDLTISCDDRATVDAVLGELPKIVEQHGFQLATEKTKVHDARGGRRIITGVAMDEKDVYPTRAVKRKLRAALHQGNDSAARGLAEWARCRIPDEYAQEIARAWAWMANQ